MSDCLPDRNVVGVATTIVPAVGSPELAELRATMQTIPVEADDVGRWVTCQRWLGELLHDFELLGWAATRMWTRRPRQSTGSENS